MISGMVMKGPTPIMSIMFSVVADRSVSPRTNGLEASASPKLPPAKASTRGFHGWRIFREVPPA
jgi:hypothetical protein